MTGVVLSPAAGPEDVEREASVDGRVVGTVRVCAWPQHLAIQGITLAEDAPADARERIRRHLVDPYVGSGARMTHAHIDDLATLQAWAASPFGGELVASGSLGTRLYVYDGLHDVPATVDGPIALGVFGDPDFRRILATTDPRELGPVIAEATWIARIVALRHLAQRDFPTDVVQDLHLFALTDDAAAVRQFAAVQLSRLYAVQRFAPTLDGLVTALADPLGALDRWGPRGPTTADGKAYEPARARRSVRAALLWIAGNLAWAADGYHAPELVDPTTVGLALRARLRDEVRRWSSAREARAVDLGTREAHGEPALATPDALGLLDLARIAVVRSRLVADDDPLAWWVQAVDSLVPDDGGRVRTTIYAPSPDTRASPSSHATSSPA